MHHVAGRVRKLPLDELKFPTGQGAAAQATSTSQQQQPSTAPPPQQQQQQQQGRKLSVTEAAIHLQPGQGEVRGGSSRRLASREAMCAGEQVSPWCGSSRTS